jgi:NADH-quinone oxidoreductase subunit E
VVTVDYEFYDQQDVESARALVAALRRGEKPAPTRGAPLTDFRGISRQLAGFSQYEDPYEMAAAVDARSSLGPTLVGLRLAEERGETAPPMPAAPAPSADAGEPRETVRPSGRTGETPGKEAADARVAAADTPAEKAGAAGSHPDAPEPAGRSLADKDDGTETPAGQEPGTSGQGPAGARRVVKGRNTPKRRG